MIAIVDYGVGNLGSALKGFQNAGFPAAVTHNPSEIERAEAVVLPGDGAFKDCYEGLEQRGLVGPIHAAIRSGKPFLGICVGMQLLFEGSDEGEPSPGLAVFRGRCIRFPDGRSTGLKVPHMGWNELRVADEGTCAMLSGLGPHPYVYFIHSYYPVPADRSVILATANHGVDFAAVVGKDNVFGMQFHPEKSQTVGLKMVKAFGELTTACPQ
ncbi:MAG: imidazole glycerol phosphate synthase subunit HisH [Candidatus Hydrogenedentes bacterium]|nr:imidazole glycerol phosphate synthase subunit HisH [Candidatus Hydrogenedentota bacterium]